MRNPLEQFKIKELIKLDILMDNLIVTDIFLYLFIGLLSIIIIESESENIKLTKKLVIKEIRKEIIEKIIRTMVSKKDEYIIILTVIFMFILILNIIGMIPYNKTITSELIITIGMSISILIGITIIGLKNQKLKLLNILIPQSTPLFLLFLLITIETVSYLARSLSLGLRLGANMIAGHTLIKIIIAFIYKLTLIDIKIDLFKIFVEPFMVHCQGFPRITKEDAMIGDKRLTVTKYTATTTFGHYLPPKIEKSTSTPPSIPSTPSTPSTPILENILLGFIDINKNNYIWIQEFITLANIIKIIICIIPITILSLIITLEIGVALIQAMVFIIIMGIYINDVEVSEKSEKTEWK